MLPVCIPLLFGASFLVLSASSMDGSQGSPPTINYTATLGKSVKCLSEVSAVREAAGLGNFKQASDVDKISDPKQGNLDDGSQWKNICEYLIPDTQPVAASNPENPFKEGTYAFMSLTAAEPNCKDTVDHWKAAFKNFTGLPPSESQAGNLYNNQDNVSFVALYNPSSDATADCRVVTCTKTTTENEETQSVSEQSPEYGYALICKTMPSAFPDGNSAPFTQDQWDKISSSLTGSASTATPGLGAFLIVAVSMTAL
ncbi:SAG family member, partial [Eimeria tenella]